MVKTAAVKMLAACYVSHVFSQGHSASSRCITTVHVRELGERGSPGKDSVWHKALFLSTNFSLSQPEAEAENPSI